MKDRLEPGKLMRLVADGLVAKGFDVRLPEPGDGRRLTIGCQGARCALSVTDWGYAEWEYCPQANAEPDPEQIADVAFTLLTDHAGNHPRRGEGYERERITLKGIVGLELKARGLDVDLEVCEDRHYFDARAEIVVTSPRTGQNAKARVGDDGSLAWERDYWAEAATVTWEPEYRGRAADPAKVASAIVETITRAMSRIRPARQAPPA
jgi:hypothetical protein